MAIEKGNPLQNFLIGRIEQDDDFKPGPTDFRPKKRKHRGFDKKNLKKPMDWFVAKLAQQGVKNPERIRELNANGSISIKHCRIISTMNKINRGNKYHPKLQKSHYKRRGKILSKAKRYVKSYGFEL